MSAQKDELDALSSRLKENGVSGFCPTTLSESHEKLPEVVERLGKWIKTYKGKGAIPLGIHLEGPFISKESAGAHPREVLRPATLKELQELWALSQGTLKILTLAPEIHTPTVLKEIIKFAKSKKIKLSLGHTRATQEQAVEAANLGFSGVTHAWNAMPFQHRNVGAIGGVIGNKKLYLELIPDLKHLDLTVLRWTLAMHPKSQICFVSDATPAACLQTGESAHFGPLVVENRDGASRLVSGALAGAGDLLPQLWTRWALLEAKSTDQNPQKFLHESLTLITENPLKALGISRSVWAKKAGKQTWQVSPKNTKNPLTILL